MIKAVIKIFKNFFKEEATYKNIGGIPFKSPCDETQEDLLIRILIAKASLKNYYK